MALTYDQQNKQLMEVVREYRVLYDKAAKGFRDINKKDNAWKDVGERLEMAPEEAKRRYTTERTKFVRYLSSLKPASGSGRDAVVLEADKEHLRWLITHIEHRRTTTSVPQTPTTTSTTTRDDNNNNVNADETKGDDDPNVVCEHSEENEGSLLLLLLLLSLLLLLLLLLLKLLVIFCKNDICVFFCFNIFYNFLISKT